MMTIIMPMRFVPQTIQDDYLSNRTHRNPYEISEIGFSYLFIIYFSYSLTNLQLNFNYRFVDPPLQFNILLRLSFVCTEFSIILYHSIIISFHVLCSSECARLILQILDYISAITHDTLCIKFSLIKKPGFVMKNEKKNYDAL